MSTPKSGGDDAAAEPLNKTASGEEAEV